MDFSVWPASNRTWAEVADTAVAAERDGWHGVWFADHFMPNVAGTVDADDPVLDVWSVLSGLAAEGNTGAGLELLIDRMRKFPNNEVFLSEIAKAPGVPS